MAILAGSIYAVLSLPKATHSYHVALEVSVIGSRRLVTFLQIKDLDRVIHANYDLGLILSDLYFIRR